MRNWLIAVLLPLFLIGQSAGAQMPSTAMLGTVFVSANSDFANGQLSGCTVEFGVLTRDWKYKSGGYISVNGSFGLMATKGVIAAVLKVILHDINPGNGTFVPSAPTDAYFVFENSATSKQYQAGSYKSDTPGAVFTIFHLEPTAMLILNGLMKDKVTIAFNRATGGMDIQVPIDTSVAETSNDGSRRKSTKAKDDFMQCAQLLLETAK
jgi:hypothetical protein